MLPGCQFNYHPGVTTLVPKLLQTSSFVQANHCATSWRNSVFFQLFQVLKWMYTMSQAMTIRQLMIFLASTLRSIAQQDFIYKTEYDFPPFNTWSDRPSPTLVPQIPRSPGSCQVHNTIFLSLEISLTFIGGILGE